MTELHTVENNQIEFNYFYLFFWLYVRWKNKQKRLKIIKLLIKRFFLFFLIFKKNIIFIELKFFT